MTYESFPIAISSNSIPNDDVENRRLSPNRRFPLWCEVTDGSRTCSCSLSKSKFQPRRTATKTTTCQTPIGIPWSERARTETQRRRKAVKVAAIFRTGVGPKRRGSCKPNGQAQVIKDPRRCLNNFPPDVDCRADREADRLASVQTMQRDCASALETLQQF